MNCKNDLGLIHNRIIDLVYFNDVSLMSQAPSTGLQMIKYRRKYRMSRKNRQVY